MMIELTNQELDWLQHFRKGSWLGGDGSKWVDRLACRGLLQRDGNVAAPLNRLLYDDSRIFRAEKVKNNEGMLAHRASVHSYRLTRRGEKALNHHQIIQ